MELTQHALGMRCRQQEILAELGVLALKGTPFAELLDETAQVAAEGLGPSSARCWNTCRPKAACWSVPGSAGRPDVVGVAKVGADLASPAGFALRTGKPVISNHLENEERFRTPELLARNGIRRAMNVILQGDGKPLRRARGRQPVAKASSSEHDIAFLQGAANLLGMAIERQRIERNLRAAVEQREMLLQEIDHRVKNSLQLVVSMLHLQASAAADEAVRLQLQEASSRIAAIARAHQRLYQGDQVRTIDLWRPISPICAAICRRRPVSCTIEPTCPSAVEVATDRAIPIALVVTELVTNAAKYAYPDARPARSGPPRRQSMPLGIEFRWRMTGSGCRRLRPVRQPRPRHADRTGPGQAGSAPRSELRSAPPAPSSRSPCRPNLRPAAEPSARRTDARSPRSPAGRAHAGHAGRRQPSGDIFGGWLLAQMDIAAGTLAFTRARGRVATVAIDGMTLPPAGARGRHRQLLRRRDPGRPDLDHHACRGLGQAQPHRRGNQGDPGPVHLRRHRRDRKPGRCRRI